jgi:hypothetical protein
MAFALVADDQMPRDIFRVLQVSMLDGRPALEWIMAADVDEVRKACLFNVLAVMAVTPTREAAFLNRVLAVFSVKTDRIAVLCASVLLPELDTLAADPRQPVYADIRRPLPVHYEMLTELPAALERQLFTNVRLWSYRAEGNPSLQIVIAETGRDYTIADVDIDLFSAKQDVVSIFGHQIIELLPNLWRRLRGKPTRVTDHLKLRRSLAKGPAAPYLGYTMDA